MKMAKRFVVFLLALGFLLPGGRPAPASAAGPEVDPALAGELAGGTASGDAPLRVILTFGRKPSTGDLDALLATGVGLHSFDALPMVAVEGTAAQIRQALGLPGLVSAYLDAPLSYYLHESVPYIGADRVGTSLRYTGRGVGVAILDTGVDGSHFDVAYPARTRQNVKILVDRSFTNPATGGSVATTAYSVYVEGLIDTDTTSGHGTHVAGIVGGSGMESGGYYTGVAPGADLIGVGAGEALSILTALEGFDWIATHAQVYNIRVVNCSWGAKGTALPGDPINVATQILHDRYRMVVVFSAGNDGPNADTLNRYSKLEWVISVAAGTKDGRLADFSSRGMQGHPLDQPTLTAPGVGIVSARASTGAAMDALTATGAAAVPPEYVARYTAANGTSMAAPHVAGVAALMLEANPALDPVAVKRLLMDTASPMFRPDGTPYEPFEVGAGYVNAYKAVQCAVDCVPPAVAAAPPGGTYYAAQPVALTASEPAIIHYTTDGTAPTTASPFYTGPINITAGTTLKFMAVDAAGNGSPVYAEEYVIPSLQGIEISPAAAGIARGSKQQFTVTARYSDGTSHDYTRIATYASSDLGVAEVNTDGVATGVAPGTATITASAEGFSVSATLQVW